MKWYDPTVEECPWVKIALARKTERDALREYGKFIIYTEDLHDVGPLADHFYAKYMESGDTAWLALGNRVLHRRRSGPAVTS